MTANDPRLPKLRVLATADHDQMLMRLRAWTDTMTFEEVAALVRDLGERKQTASREQRAILTLAEFGLVTVLASMGEVDNG